MQDSIGCDLATCEQCAMECERCDDPLAVVCDPELSASIGGRDFDEDGSPLSAY